MQRIKDKELEPTEWQVDPKTGERFRMIGKIKEYELMVRIDGIEIPQSQLADYHKRKKEAEERRKAEAMEAAKNRPEPKSCPFANGCNTTCKREGCKIFANGKCALATIADASGVEIEEAPAKDNRKCPFSIYGHCKGCALYNKGCAIVRLAASTINK
ncbi:hypothetical protein [Phascolarctobacterium sp.]|uniref:hypothetical protein n=1 Tax=Phascolarctobacterium sp. TaxID=2049039 RepID=UPI003864C6F8